MAAVHSPTIPWELNTAANIIKQLLDKVGQNIVRFVTINGEQINYLAHRNALVIGFPEGGGTPG